MKLIKTILIAIISLLMLVSSFGCADPSALPRDDQSGVVIGGEDHSTVPAAETATHGRDLATLREQCPQYFGLSVMKGLEIYVCSFAPDNFQYRIMEGTNRIKTDEEISVLPGLTSEEVKTILATYDIGSESITIIASRNPLSSYYYEIDGEYANKVSEQFGGMYRVMTLTDQGTPLDSN